MNWKTIIISSIFGLLTFGLGWVFSDMKQADDLQKISPKCAVITQQHDSLAGSVNVNKNTENFAMKISGKFVMKDANCAGFNFLSSSLVSWTNEIDCEDPDTLKLRWLDNATFFTRDIKPVNEHSPPRVDVYQVVSFDGNRLIVTKIWTGLNDFEDRTLEFIKQSNNN